MSNPSSPIDSKNTTASGKSAQPFFTRCANYRVFNWGIIVVVLFFTLPLTFWVSYHAKKDLAHEQQVQFETRASEVTHAIKDRMGIYEQVLRGGVGLFAASESVTRTEWKDYVASLELQESYPGIQGLGVSVLIPAAQLDAHLGTIRAEGFPDYAIRPPDARAEYTSIIYLEPFNVRNQEAFGFDMFSDPTRRAAMSKARDTGDASISSKVVLVTEGKRELQAGILMYLPIYENGTLHNTLAQRRASLVGYVFSPFRLNDLMIGILEETSPDPDIDIEIYDGTVRSAGSLLYDADNIPHALGTPPDGSMTLTRSLDLYGQNWLLYFTTRPAFNAAFDSNQPLLILLIGTVLSVMLSALIWLLTSRQQRARDQANRLAGDLREIEATQFAIINTALDAVVQMDSAGVITNWNDQAEQIFGWSKVEVIGRMLDEMIIPPQYREAHNRGLKHFLATGEGPILNTRREITGLHRDGREFPIELAIAPLKIAGKDAFSAFMRDITWAKRQEYQILQLNTSLIEADRVKDKFIEDMNHDLRTPLTVIIGYMEEIIDDVDSGVEPKLASSLTTVQRNAVRLQVLVENLMQNADMKTSDTPLVVSTMSVGRLLGNIVKSLELGASHSRVEVTLRLDSPANDLLIVGDVNQLERVFVNLVHNAIKYTPHEGKVTIVARRVRTDGDYVEVTVTDTGIGIPREEFPNVFERFFRASTATQTSISGYGIGLSLAHSIVLRHHGTITFDSTVGKGTVFTVRLPVGFIPRDHLNSR